MVMPQNPFEELIVLGTIFVILLAIGIYFILGIRRKIKNPEKITADDLLLRFSQLYDAGLLTREEYRLVKMRLASKLGQFSDLQRAETTSSRTENKTGKKKDANAARDPEFLLQQILTSELSISADGAFGKSTGKNTIYPTRKILSNHEEAEETDEEA
ncbi:MAG: hypothetical protein Q4G68_01470 [Planctomycetia bacterium]|nr:hypothetical protein [Planctomycetia bacterium]